MSLALRAFLTCLLLTVVSLLVGVFTADSTRGAKPSRAEQAAAFCLIVFGTGMGLCLVWLIWS